MFSLVLVLEGMPTADYEYDYDDEYEQLLDYEHDYEHEHEWEGGVRACSHTPTHKLRLKVPPRLV